MSELKHARSFRDLVVYQKARRVAKHLFELTKGFPNEERYSLTDQVRRPSRSVGAQITEAWAKRRYEKHFVSKLTDADGEQQETQVQGRDISSAPRVPVLACMWQFALLFGTLAPKQAKVAVLFARIFRRVAARTAIGPAWSGRASRFRLSLLHLFDVSLG